MLHINYEKFTSNKKPFTIESTSIKNIVDPHTHTHTVAATKSTLSASVSILWLNGMCTVNKANR